MIRTWNRTLLWISSVSYCNGCSTHTRAVGALLFSYGSVTTETLLIFISVEKYLIKSIIRKNIVPVPLFSIAIVIKYALELFEETNSSYAVSFSF